MSKICDFFRNRHILISLAIGSSIIILAYFSKRVLPEPIENLWLAVPPFIGTIYESLLGCKYKDSKITTVWPWILAILGSTAVVIALHA